MNQPAFSPIEALHRFAADALTEPNRMDNESGLVREAYTEYVRRGLNRVGGERVPLAPEQAFDYLSALAEYSGAFAFTALQQFVANMHLRVDIALPWPMAGVAFGHIRNPEGVSPVWSEGLVSGRVPWMTGAGIFQTVQLGVVTDSGEEAFTWVDAHDRPAFRWSRPMPLFVGFGTATVSVTVDSLIVPVERLFGHSPRGTMGERDRHGAVWQTPLLFGALAAAVELIDSSSIDSNLKGRVCCAITDLRQECRRAMAEGTTPEQGTRLRSRAGDLAVRVARLAGMAVGGSSLMTHSAAQRIYREVQLYSLMAQTPEIVADAFLQVTT